MSAMTSGLVSLQRLLKERLLATFPQCKPTDPSNSLSYWSSPSAVTSAVAINALLAVQLPFRTS